MNLPDNHPLAALFDLHVPGAQGERRLRLRVPSTRQVYPLILLPDERTAARLGAILPLEFADMILSLDDRQATLADADALASDPQTASALVARQRNLFESLSEQGRAYAQCPACREWDADLTLTSLMLLLQTAPWPIFEGPFLALPSLALLLERGRRPEGMPRTSRLRYELPSSVLEGNAQGGVLGDLDEDPRRPREMAAWARWASPGAPSSPERADWNSGVPGFRALLRLCVALEGGEETQGAVSPETIEQMPVTDFFFLDQLYYLTHNVTLVSAQSMCSCERCGAHFLPVR